MNEFDILEAIGNVDDEFVVSAKIRKKGKRHRIIGFTAFGSVLLLIICTYVFLFPFLNVTPPVTAPPSDTDLPLTEEEPTPTLPSDTLDDTPEGTIDLPPSALGPQNSIPDYIPSFYRTNLLLDGELYSVTDDETIVLFVKWVTELMSNCTTAQTLPEFENQHRYTLILFYGSKLVCDLTLTDGGNGCYYVTNNISKITYSIDQKLFLKFYNIIEDIK